MHLSDRTCAIYSIIHLNKSSMYISEIWEFTIECLFSIAPMLNVVATESLEDFFSFNIDS